MEIHRVNFTYTLSQLGENIAEIVRADFYDAIRKMNQLKRHNVLIQGIEDHIDGNILTVIVKYSLHSLTYANS